MCSSRLILRRRSTEGIPKERDGTRKLLYSAGYIAGGAPLPELGARYTMYTPGKHVFFFFGGEQGFSPVPG